MSKIVKVVSNITDRQKVTLFHPDGSSTTIPQGDPRLAAAMKTIIPMNHRGEVATVNLSTFEVYGAVAEQSSGLLKFFRVAKQKLKDFLSGSEEKPEPVAREIQIEESEPEEYQVTDVVTIMYRDALSKAERFLEEHAVTQTAELPLASTETVAAVVDGQIISDVEKVEPFLKHALATGRTEAVNRFFKLCAEVAKDRRHSVEDLFSFLERASLPLSDDGHILAYKMLERPKNNDRKADQGYYVDRHSKKVFQRPGCKVQVPDELVDLSRDRDCSNGLHIASRQYLRTYGGDVIMLCKIDPRDVMAVPHADVTKVRVRAYHILGILSQEAMNRIKSDRPITDLVQDHALLTGAMSGQHIPVLETVLIQGQKGKDIQHTEHAENGPDLWKTFLPEHVAPEVTAVLAEVTKEATAPHVTPTQVREMAAEASSTPTPTKQAPNKVRQAHSVWLKNKDRLNFTTFLAAKKKAKKGWEVLGFSEAEVKEIKATIKKYDL